MAAMAASTASSPSFLAGLTGAPSSSRLVWESSGLAVRLALILAARRPSTSFWLISWLIHCHGPEWNSRRRVIPRKGRHCLGKERHCPFGGQDLGRMRRLPHLAVEPHRQARRRHETLGLAYGAFTIVKDRGREHRRGVAVAHAFHQMLERADPAARDHRHRNRIGNRPG